MNRQPVATWTAKQERLALLLASGKGIKAAAAETGVGERTVHSWLDHPEFRTRVNELRGQMLDDAMGKLADTAGAAVDVLRGLLGDANGNVRLRAALGILDTLVKCREHVEFDERILSLENQLNNATASQPPQ